MNTVRKQRGKKACGWALPGAGSLGQERRVLAAWNLVCRSLASLAAGGKHLSVGPQEALVNRKPGRSGRWPNGLSP